MKIEYARTSDTHLIPKRIGAYVITHTPDNVHAEKYVGATENLYIRMFHQTHSRKKIMYVDLYITDDINLALSLERILIESIDPATNTQIPSLSDKDKETMKELMKDSKIKEILSDNTMKIGCRYLKYVIGDKKKFGNRVRTVIIDDSVHKKLETVHELLKEKYKAKVSYGDIIARLLDNPEKIAETFFDKNNEVT